MTYGYDIPETRLEQAVMIEALLSGAATDGEIDDKRYTYLRRELMDDPVLHDLLPGFVRRFRDLRGFRTHSQSKYDTWRERRQFVMEEFTPLLDYLEGQKAHPSDSIADDTLRSYDADGIHEVWQKALARRSTDPEGAITVARTLLETVCKRVLEDTGTEYNDKDDLPKLYFAVAEQLNLAPEQHSEKAIKTILGGATQMVHGIGTLRNKLSDSHGRGGRLPVKPSERHAALAVNTAGAVATFIIETHNAQKG